jgi:hypothetical protein
MEPVHTGEAAGVTVEGGRLTQGIPAENALSLGLVQFVATDPILQGIARPDRKGTAGSSRVDTATIAGLVHTLLFEGFPATLEIAAFVVETDVVDLTAPAGLQRGFNGVHHCAAVRTFRIALHRSASSFVCIVARVVLNAPCPNSPAIARNRAFASTPGQIL